MSLQAEAAAIGAGLASDRAADLLVDLLDPAAVTNTAHRAILDAIRDLRSTGQTADLPTVTDALHRAGRLEEAGEATGVYDLLAAAPPGQVEQWCRIVTTAHRRRRMLGVVEQLRVEAETADDVDVLAEEAVEQLLALSGGAASTSRDELLAAFDKRVTTGSALAGWKMPWQQLAFFRLPDDGLTVWTGLPGSGKSTMLDATVAAWLDLHPEMAVAFFSPEQAPSDNHLHELVRTTMGQDPRRDVAEATRQAERLTERVHWIDDDRHSTAGAVLAQARRLVRDRGVRLLVIDPYNNLEPDGDAKHERQDLHIQALLRRLRRFARSAQVAVVVVAHPRRTEKVAHTDAVYRIPTAGDISGGQEWWNHSDAIVSVWRNQSGEEPQQFGSPLDVKVVVSKVRFSKWGATGKGSLAFDTYGRRYR